MLVLIPAVFAPYRDAALLRLQYLYPPVKFTLGDTGVELATDASVDLQQVARDLRYALYREKIYAETLPLRRALMNAVSRT